MSSHVGFADGLEREVAHPGDGGTVDERLDFRQPHRAPGRDRCRDARRAFRLDADDAHLGMSMAQPRRCSRKQAAAPDGEHHDVGHETELVERLDDDGGLPGDDARVVEGRHGDAACFHGIGLGGIQRRIVGAAHHLQLDVTLADGLDPIALLPRRGAGNEDRGVDAQHRAAESDALRMVARRSAHHAGELVLLAELGHQRVGAAQLIRANRLLIFALQPDLAPRGRRQPLVALDGGALGHAGEAPCGLGDLWNQISEDAHRTIVYHLGASVSRPTGRDYRVGPPTPPRPLFLPHRRASPARRARGSAPRWA